MRSRPALLIAGLCLIAAAAYAPVVIARRKLHAKAVLIRRVDGPLEWTPVEGLSRIYVVR